MEQTKPQIPDILTQVSREKFRRRLLISSRLLAVLLIFAIFYFGYTNFKYGDLVSRSPCYACGYYGGKQCDYVLLPDTFTHTYTYEEKQAFLENLGRYNENTSGSSKSSNTLIDRNFNISKLNITNNSNINFNKS